MKGQRLISGLVAVGALLGALGTADAYEPLREQGVEQMVGKTVYLAVSKEQRDLLAGASKPARWLRPGTALTITATRPGGTHGNRSITTIITKTADGQEVFLSAEALSSEPLKYSYDNPGTLESFLSNLFSEAYVLPAKMDAIASKYDYDEITGVADMVLYKAMQDVFQEQSDLLDRFSRGSSVSTESLLRSAEYKWIVDAKDPAFMEAYSKGLKGTPLADRVRQSADIINLLRHSISLTIEIRNTKRALREKRWLRGLENAPPDKIAKLDAERSAEHTEKIAKKRQDLKDLFEKATALMAKLNPAEQPPVKTPTKRHR